MKVYLDISPVTAEKRKRTGLARTSVELARALATLENLEITIGGFGSLSASKNVWEVQKSGELNSPIFPNRISRIVEIGASWGEGTNPLLAGLSRGINLTRNQFPAIGKGNFDVLHSIYARFPAGLKSDRSPKLLTVHDLIPLLLPSGMFSADQVRITKRIIDSIQKGTFIACPSEATRRDVIEYTGCREDMTFVVPWGVDHTIFRPVDPASAKRKHGLDGKKYFVTLSSLAANKNVPFLVECFCKAAKNVNQRDTLLVLIGGHSRNALTQGSSIGDTDLVKETGFIEDEELAGILSGAEAFLFPSLYEGFGLPIIEAMACGLPVACGDRGSMPEVVGAAGSCLNATDKDQWIFWLESAMSSPMRIAPHMPSISRASEFNWQITAKHHSQIYQRIRSSACR